MQSCNVKEQPIGQYIKRKLLNNAGEIRMMDILIKNAIIVTVNKERSYF